MHDCAFERAETLDVWPSNMVEGAPGGDQDVRSVFEDRAIGTFHFDVPFRFLLLIPTFEDLVA